MNSYSYIFLLVLIATTLNIIDGRRTKNKDAKDRDDAKTTEIDSIICPTCEKLFCAVRKPSKLKCKGGGTTTDICGCCPVCAKRLGEPCGGKWNYLGKCDIGLYCEADTMSFLTPSFFQHMKPEVPKRGMAEGTCVKNKEFQKDGGSVISETQSTRSSHHPKCQPKCTPDFCLRNPRSICSAVDVVDMKRDCHGSCQHTSCQACSWVDPDPDCGACSSDDFNCIRKFAKCIKRSYCTRSKFPCKSIAEEDHVGKFQCMVAKCLDKS